MDRKNRELARRNTELLEEISRLTDIHSDILKVNIKQKYYRTRTYNKLVDHVDRQIVSLKEVLESSMFLRESLIGSMEIKEVSRVLEDTRTESDTSVFKQTMKILDTIYTHEEEDTTQPKKSNLKIKLKTNEQSTSNPTYKPEGGEHKSIVIEDGQHKSIILEDNKLTENQFSDNKHSDNKLTDNIIRDKAEILIHKRTQSRNPKKAILKEKNQNKAVKKKRKSVTRK